MIKLKGTYAENDQEMEYLGRIFQWCTGKGFSHKASIWKDGLDKDVEVKHGDVLYVLGQGTWFAHYRPSKPDPNVKECPSCSNMINLGAHDDVSRFSHKEDCQELIKLITNT